MAQNISHHINRIYEEGELAPEATVKNYLTVRQEGKRQVNRPLPLVPKLQLGNEVGEAPASRDGKLELPVPHSQAGTWERVNIYEESEPNKQATYKNFLQARQENTKDSA